METKRKSVVTTQQRESGLIAFVVADIGEIVFDPKKAHVANRAYAEFHGWKQRHVDAAALSHDTTTGKAATPQEKYDAIKALRDHYESGVAEWSVAGGEGTGRSLIIEAIAKVKGLTYEEAVKTVEAFAVKSYAGDTKKALAFLRTGERVMAAMDEIRKSRAAKPAIDADAALAELA